MFYFLTAKTLCQKHEPSAPVADGWWLWMSGCNLTSSVNDVETTRNEYIQIEIQYRTADENWPSQRMSGLETPVGVCGSAGVLGVSPMSQEPRSSTTSDTTVVVAGNSGSSSTMVVSKRLWKPTLTTWNFRSSRSVFCPYRVRGLRLFTAPL